MCQSIWNSTCARCPQILCITICLGILPSKTLSNDITDSVILTAYAVQECNLGFTVLAIHRRSLAHHRPSSMTPCPRQWTRQDCGKRAPLNTHLPVVLSVVPQSVRIILSYNQIITTV